MFRKPFKVRSNNQLKSTERKLFKENILKSFTILSREDVDAIISKKDVVCCSKIITANDETVLVYSVNKCPLFFTVENVMYPTIYLIWKHAKVGITLTTTNFVASKISQGADLMIPGVLTPVQLEKPFGMNDLAVVNTATTGCIAVGTTAMASPDMIISTSGRAVKILHYYGDKLCTIDGTLQPVPNSISRLFSEFVESKDECSPFTSQKDDFPPLIPEKKPPSVEEAEVQQIDEVAKEHDQEECDKEMPTDKPNIVSTADMDDLLKYCFMAAIKYSKTIKLPVLTSTFYKSEMLQNCPPDKELDIKKSSYKKVGKFLQSMMEEKLIVIKEIKKGVEAIASIDKEHPSFRQFYLRTENRPKNPNEPDDSSNVPEINELYVVTQTVAPIFKEAGLNKGSTVKASAIRQHVTAFVKKHNLQSQDDKQFVKVKDNPALSAIIKNEEAVTWEDLMQTVIAAMKSRFTVQTSAEATAGAGKIPPITMIVQTRSGNKKVTIVDNVGLYGINLKDFGKECQHGIAASTSISKPAGKKYEQILIQGNQVLFVYNLLTEKYKIPKKYIKGLEYAPKTK